MSNLNYDPRLPPLGPKEVRAIRRKVKLSQHEFANAINAIDPSLRTSTTNVSRWERGTYRPSRIAQIAIRAMMQKEDHHEHNTTDQPGTDNAPS